MSTPVVEQPDGSIVLSFADQSFIRFTAATEDLGITGITFASPDPDLINTRARELGLWREDRDGIFIGDVAFNFV